MAPESSLWKIQLVCALVSAGILGVVVSLIRQRKLLEAYSLLWLGTGTLLLTLSVWKDLLVWLAGALGVVYPPALLVVIVVFASLSLFLHFSVVISRLHNQNARLAQDLALLRAELGARRAREPSDASV